MIATLFLLSLVSGTWAAALWPQGSYNAQKSNFVTTNKPTLTLQCQPTLTQTIPVTSRYPDFFYDPVISNNSVLFFAHDQNKLTALDLANNKNLWTLEANSYFNPPVLSQDGDILYTIKDLMNFTAYSVESQEVIWYYDTIPVDTWKMLMRDFTVAPNGVVYVTMFELDSTSNFTALYAFDITKPINSALWNRTDLKLWEAPVISGDGKVYVQDYNELLLLDPNNGSTIWTLELQNINGLRSRPDNNLLVSVEAGLLLVAPNGTILKIQPNFSSVAVTPDNKVIGVTLRAKDMNLEKIDNPADSFTNPLLALIAANFSVVEWSKPYPGGFVDVIDNYIFAHTTPAVDGDASVTMIDMQGNIIWTTSFQVEGVAITGSSHVIPVGDGSAVTRTATTVYRFTTCNNGHGTCKATGGACECVPNYYTDDCSKYCDAQTCSNNGKCNNVGQCECEADWSGPTCTEKQNNNGNNHNLIVGLAVGGAVLAVGAVAVALVIRRRRSNYEAIKS